MHYWLIKFAPFRTSWAEVVKRGGFMMRGVRSQQARNNLAQMRVGDPVFFYHSQQDRAIEGLMAVSREAYPDPTCGDSHWLTCDFAPIRPLSRRITLEEIKRSPALKELALIRQPRLAVIPVSVEQFSTILRLSDELSQASHSPLG